MINSTQVVESHFPRDNERSGVISRADVLIGKDVLELLTGAMYVDPLSIYREYIQNAADAIDALRAKQGLTDHGHIDITIDVTKRAIIIRDNGLSLTSDQFLPRLLAIGVSQKRGTVSRGFRGIGRLAGLAYCQELSFRGRAAPHEPVTQVVLNARRLRELLNDHDAARDLETAVVEIAAVNKISSGNWPDRFFEVELSKTIRVKNDVLLNAEAVRDYLAQVAPVPFHSDFKFGKAIEQFLTRHGIGPAIEIVLNRTLPVRRPHNQEFSLTPKLRDKFRDIQFFEISGLDGNLDCVGWILDHAYLGALPKSLTISGVRLRVGDIQVGDSDILADLFSEPRFNGWCVGEFHVLNRKIVPNGRRDNFEHSMHLLNLQSHLAKIATDVSRTCRSRSGIRNSLKGTNHQLAKIESDLETFRAIPYDFPYRQKHIALLLESLERQETHIKTKLSNTADCEALLERVSEIRRKFQRTASKTRDTGILKRLAPVKRRAYIEVLSMVYDVAPNNAIAYEYVNKIIKRIGKK